MAIKKVIFDLGNVLVKFNPKNLFRKIFTTEEEVDFFLHNICTWDWHIQQDLVYDTSQAATPLIQKHPQYKEAIEAFYERFLEMIEGNYEANIQLAFSIQKLGYPIYILSNFPGDQFEKYRRNNNYIDQFDDRIISGNVGMAKPDINIYKLAIKQFNLIPEHSLFIDDKIENTKSAEACGINTIQLSNPEHLTNLIKKIINF